MANSLTTHLTIRRAIHGSHTIILILLVGFAGLAIAYRLVVWNSSSLWALHKPREQSATSVDSSQETKRNMALDFALWIKSCTNLVV